MANNQYVNKVVYGNATLIDTSGVTVTPDKLLSGYTALDASGQLITGTAAAGEGSAITIVDTQDENGGIIRTITGVSLAGDTVTASHLESGYTAHDALGNPITGTLSPGTTPTGTISITTNGTHDVSSYAYANVNVSSQAPSLQAKTNISPTESSQTITPDTGYDGLSSVQINAVSSTYVGSGVTRKAAATITPTKSTQTIASGTYLTGTQTIAAIPAAYQDVTGVTAAAGDVVNGKTIVDSTGATVNGTLVVQHYYTGSSAPSSSLGENGDIYLQT